MFATPSTDHRLSYLPEAKRLHSGLEGWLWDIGGRWRRRSRLADELLDEAEQVLENQARFEKESNRHLADLFLQLSGRFRRGPAPEDIREALAAAAEVSRRTLYLEPYREQVAGALALDRGCLAEMATGEGKTLTIGLAAVLAGLVGRPVHVVTANDYLAERDAVALKPFFHGCGLTVGHIQGDMSADVRRINYRRSLTYGTSKEIVADFLRDRLVLGEFQDSRRRALQKLLSRPAVRSDALVLNGMFTAIVDEADHVLIDEAVTPLLISEQHPNEYLQAAVMKAHEEAAAFLEGRDFETDPKFGELTLTSEGRRRLEEIPPERCLLFQNARWKEELLMQALRARVFFLRGRHYVIDGGKVVIIDETTGRPAPQRSWRQGLHQAIEAKEGLELSIPTENLASLSFQRFFRHYRRLSGVTGTGKENAKELWHIYHLPIVILPTHRPCIRKFAGDVYAPAAEEKWTAVLAEVAAVHSVGRPVLVGCGSVSASEILAARLAAAGFNFRLLNATQLKHEAEIVADAGQPGMITVATNLAGRGTDIRLGAGVAETGGLHVIATEHALSGRVDRQLFGRCARQGDPGSVRLFACVEDELPRRFLPGWARRCLAHLLSRWPSGGVWFCHRLFRFCQMAATGMDYRRRLGVLRRDRWLTRMLPLWGMDQSLRER